MSLPASTSAIWSDSYKGEYCLLVRTVPDNCWRTPGKWQWLWIITLSHGLMRPFLGTRSNKEAKTLSIISFTLCSFLNFCKLKAMPSKNFKIVIVRLCFSLKQMYLIIFNLTWHRNSKDNIDIFFNRPIKLLLDFKCLAPISVTPHDRLWIIKA